MINKKEFKELDILQQVDLVNEELKAAKGTKNFGKTNLDFSYGFARTILTSNGYETLDETTIDGVKVKLFRKMNEEELQAKEEKVVAKQEIIEKPIEAHPAIDASQLPIIIASDMYDKNLEIPIEKKTTSRSLPIFDDTYEEFNQLLKSNEFKLYEKKYVVELMFRTFLDKYNPSHEEIKEDAEHLED
jgi:hypothetical protein